MAKNHQIELGVEVQSTTETESVPRDDVVAAEAGGSSIGEMTVSNARLSLSSFGLSGCLSLVAICVLFVSDEIVQQVRTYAPLVVLANYVLANIYLRLVHQGYHYQVLKYLISLALQHLNSIMNQLSSIMRDFKKKKLFKK